MDYPTTLTLLSWMVFLPLIGAALILVLACVEGAVNGSKEFFDNASRAVGLATCAVVLLLGCFLWKELRRRLDEAAVRPSLRLDAAVQHRVLPGR